MNTTNTKTRVLGPRDRLYGDEQVSHPMISGNSTVWNIGFTGGTVADFRAWFARQFPHFATVPKLLRTVDVGTVEQQMARATKAARRKTTLGKMEALLAERSKWQRRQTIATNKLAETQRALDALLKETANDIFEKQLSQ